MSTVAPAAPQKINLRRPDIMEAEWNLRAPIPTQKELETWWEELQKNPPYEPPDQVELLAQELSQEKLARKQLEELNKTLGNELSDIKLSLLSLKGDLAE
ncbi:MAG: XkdW family protein [Bacillota bacterium]|nr:XkdW family protein [Bacillota bacterium]